MTDMIFVIYLSNMNLALGVGTVSVVGASVGVVLLSIRFGCVLLVLVPSQTLVPTLPLHGMMLI